MSATTANLTIRLEKSVKEKAEELFDSLGMSLTTAFNVFIRQSIRVQGIPFEIRRDAPNAETLLAMKEAETLAHDPSVLSYKDMDSLKKALLS